VLLAPTVVVEPARLLAVYQVVEDAGEAGAVSLQSGDLGAESVKVAPEPDSEVAMQVMEPVALALGDAAGQRVEAVAAEGGGDVEDVGAGLA